MPQAVQEQNGVKFEIPEIGVVFVPNGIETLDDVKNAHSAVVAAKAAGHIANVAPIAAIITDSIPYQFNTDFDFHIRSGATATSLLLQLDESLGGFEDSAGNLWSAGSSFITFRVEMVDSSGNYLLWEGLRGADPGDGSVCLTLTTNEYFKSGQSSPSTLGAGVGEFDLTTAVEADFVIHAEETKDDVFIDLENEFGAAGDGTTDDSAKFNAAINRAAALGGGVVYLRPYSTYAVNASSIMMKSNVTLWGYGATIKRTGTKWMLRNEGTDWDFVAHSNIKILGVTFDLNLTSQYCMAFAHVTGLVIQDCKVYNAADSDTSSVSIDIQTGCKKVWIVNNELDTAGGVYVRAHDQNGMAPGGVNQVFITGNYIHDTNLRDHNESLGIFTSSPGANTLSNVCVANNIIDSSGAKAGAIAIYRHENASNKPTDISIINNKLYGVTPTAASSRVIYCLDNDGLIIANNHLNGGLYAIWLKGQTTTPELLSNNITITGNTIENCIRGIHDIWAQDCVIANNMISHNTAGVAGFGISGAGPLRIAAELNLLIANNVIKNTQATSVAINLNPGALSIRSATYTWTLSGSGTGEYYLGLASEDPSLVEPGDVLENAVAMTEATVGSLSAGEWDYGDNDTLGFSTIYVRLADSTDPDSKAADYVTYVDLADGTEIAVKSLRAGRYKWLLSGSGTSEYYVVLAPGLNEPTEVLEGGTAMTMGTVGTLNASEWDYGDNDSLGYNTIYVRQDDDADPDGEVADHIEAAYVPTQIKITGNLLEGGQDGMLIDGVSDIEATDNTIADFARYGVRIGAAKVIPDNINVSNNTFRSTSTSRRIYHEDSFVETTNQQNNTGVNPVDDRVIIIAKNTSGGGLVLGDCVILKAVANALEVTTTTTQGDDKVYGMVAETIANNGWGKILILGKTEALKVDGTIDIAIGDLLGTFTTAKIAMKAAAGDMAFAVALEAYITDDSAGVIDALLIPPRKV